MNENGYPRKYTKRMKEHLLRDITCIILIFVFVLFSFSPHFTFIHFFWFFFFSIFVLYFLIFFLISFGLWCVHSVCIVFHRHNVCFFFQFYYNACERLPYEMPCVHNIANNLMYFRVLRKQKKENIYYWRFADVQLYFVLVVVIVIVDVVLAWNSNTETATSDSLIFNAVNVQR